MTMDFATKLREFKTEVRFLESEKLNINRGKSLTWKN
jgi:hypothetical protein